MYGFRFPCFLRHGFGNVPTSLRYARHTSRYAANTSEILEVFAAYLEVYGAYLRKGGSVEKTIPQEACQKPYLRKHGKTIPQEAWKTIPQEPWKNNTGPPKVNIFCTRSTKNQYFLPPDHPKSIFSVSGTSKINIFCSRTTKNQYFLSWNTKN